MNELVIRQGRVSQAIALWKEIPEFTESSHEKECEEKLAGKTPYVLIATEQGKPAGFLIGYEREDKSFFLWMIGVLPSFRKKGILKEFYTRAADWAKRMGYSKITITTRNNRREMLSFLVKNDFEFTSIDAREKIEDYRIHAQKRL